MSLLSTRDYYKPFDYSWMFEYYDLQNRMHWHPMSVPLHNDVKDWNERRVHHPDPWLHAPVQVSSWPPRPVPYQHQPDPQ